MVVAIPRGERDPAIDSIIGALAPFGATRPLARLDIYRQNVVSIRVRIIDPGFAGETKSQRSVRVWHYLEGLPEEIAGDISTMLLLTPTEVARSFANVEFEDPVPSGL